MKCWDRVDDVRALTAQVSALVVLTNHLLGPDDATVGAELTTPRGHFSRRAPSQPLSRTQGWNRPRRAAYNATKKSATGAQSSSILVGRAARATERQNACAAERYLKSETGGANTVPLVNSDARDTPEAVSLATV